MPVAARQWRRQRAQRRRCCTAPVASPSLQLIRIAMETSTVTHSGQCHCGAVRWVGALGAAWEARGQRAAADTTSRSEH